MTSIGKLIVFIFGLIVFAVIGFIALFSIESYQWEKRRDIRCAKNAKITMPWMNYLAEQMTKEGIPKTIEKSNYVPYELNCKKAHLNYEGNEVSSLQQYCSFDNNKTDNRLYQIQVNHSYGINNNYSYFNIRVLDKSTEPGYFFTIMQYDFLYDETSKKWIAQEGMCPGRSWGH
jgi:hypothetical protein